MARRGDPRFVRIDHGASALDRRPRRLRPEVAAGGVLREGEGRQVAVAADLAQDVTVRAALGSACEQRLRRDQVHHVHHGGRRAGACDALDRGHDLVRPAAPAAQLMRHPEPDQAAVGQPLDRLAGNREADRPSPSGRAIVAHRPSSTAGISITLMSPPRPGSTATAKNPAGGRAVRGPPRTRRARRGFGAVARSANTRSPIVSMSAIGSSRATVRPARRVAATSCSSTDPVDQRIIVQQQLGPVARIGSG